MSYSKSDNEVAQRSKLDINSRIHGQEILLVISHQKANDGFQLLINQQWLTAG